MILENLSLPQSVRTEARGDNDNGVCQAGCDDCRFFQKCVTIPQTLEGIKMEQLIVENFLVIKEAEVKVGKINVIIGPQANGKSLLAKLLYFCRKSISEKLLISVKNNELKSDYIKGIEKAFEKYFPKYTWKEKSFLVKYIYNEYTITISKKKAQRKVTVNISDELSSLLKNLRSKYRAFQKKSNGNEVLWNIFFDFRKEHMYNNKDFGKLFGESVFIPASRSFFANLQKNIFSFLSKNIDIDPFISEFGSQYEFTKSIYSMELIQNNQIVKTKLYKKIKSLSENILSGSYHYKDEQDWIEMEGDMVNLSNTSSGQQEALPMLLVLAVLPFLDINRDGKFYFLEEPEAHLFPTSQKNIVSLISLIYKYGESILITTHSPYILTAFNNYIYAYDIMEKYGEKSIKDIVDSDFCINYDDFQAYTIENGILKSIKNDDTRLIGVNIIDSVSDEFNETFDKLISLDME